MPHVSLPKYVVATTDGAAAFTVHLSTNDKAAAQAAKTANPGSTVVHVMPAGGFDDVPHPHPTPTPPTPHSH